jgi:hypothetical protein
LDKRWRELGPSLNFAGAAISAGIFILYGKESFANS